MSLVIFGFFIPVSSRISLSRPFFSVSPSSNPPVIDCQNPPSFWALRRSKYSIFAAFLRYIIPSTCTGSLIFSDWFFCI